MRARTLTALLLSAAAGLGGILVAQAATKTATFKVSATVQSDCTITATDLAFGNVGLVTANVDATSTLTITCTSGTAYTIALNAGTAAASTIANRRMASGANSLGFQLYRDAGRSQIWGETSGTDTLGGSGTGSAASVTVYGRIAPQAAPPAGAYETTITATITY